ncbi:hypothetical protein NA655_08420 [Pseudomonas kuykendallii]|nr:hypothetical protein [Pseudomonas kuykendallii]MCQ4271043.1 hypothetical protein [Pseudomonas kuykendallii]
MSTTTASLMRLGNRAHWDANPRESNDMTQATTIEGLKVTVGGTELRDLCAKQAAFHAERAVKYSQQHASLEDAQIEAMHYTNGDPKKAIADKQAEHENKARELTFIAEHIKLDCEYLLDRSALAEIGVIRSSRFLF